MRDFLNSPTGRYLSVGVCALGVLALGWLLVSQFSGPDAASLSRRRTYIDATTGQAFVHTLSEGDKVPVEAPSGGRSGYPAEWCNWTADGQIKPEATPVLLNRYKGETGPTFCPDCGRLVRERNPPGISGAKPPITRDEYDKTGQLPPREDE